MGSVYLTGLADWCRAAGLEVFEQAGWQTRGRSSGGYEPGRPWCVMWHHTASYSSPVNDAEYIATGSADSPLANVLLDRTGAVWICAAGATNTNGKGGPYPVSRGTIPADQMNTYAVGIEAANDGQGEPWPLEQIDAYFVLSLTLTGRLGLSPVDVCTHQVWAPTRKIDPARADAVIGEWRPSSSTSAGTWDLFDIQAELLERAGEPPPPTPGPPAKGRPKMIVVALDSNGTAWIGDGIKRQPLTDGDVFTRYVLVHGATGSFVNTSGRAVNGWEDVQTVDPFTLEALGRE